ncbi:MAG: hypothetical protein NVS9B5_37150 [Terriglobales bacterium]
MKDAERAIRVILTEEPQVRPQVWNRKSAAITFASLTPLWEPTV